MINKTASTFDGLRRIDCRDYPETALSEALLNAVVHRDYSTGGSILIKIFTNNRKQSEQLLGLSQTASGVILRKLVDQGVLVREGYSRNIRYFEVK